jgi:hypothetical protein
MASNNPSLATARRNRIIAIAAGVITIVAIVLAFASEYLELPWKWIRPAAELLLLGELVGLVVLERHQLFEPVHEKVSGIESTLAAAKLGDMSATVAMLGERAKAAGQIMTCVGPREVYAARARCLRDALARNEEGPHMMRGALLSGRALVEDTREVGEAFAEMIKVLSEFVLLPGSPPDARARRWSNRALMTCATTELFGRMLTWLEPLLIEPGCLNTDVKILVRSQPEALLSPATITDRDVVLVYDDELSSHRWGLVLQGRQYVSLFSRWFDDRWGAIPDRYQIFGRGVLNQKAVDLIRSELATNEVARERASA